MNGVWTCDKSKLNTQELGNFPYQAEMGGGLLRLGGLDENNAIAFFQRMGEIGTHALVMKAIPKDVREDFYAGKCVMISLGENRIGFVNMKIVSENKKKPLTPPTEPC